MDLSDFLAKLYQKTQMSVIFDIDNCILSFYLHLQVIIFMLLRTTSSFHGNDSRRVGAVTRAAASKSKVNSV